jgi:flavin reductase (DIM6/NTAB) family NADH-FMN oxidoreductase RutF
MQLSSEQLAALPRRYRAQLINCLPGFKPAVLVGTADKEGNSNLAIVNSVFHLGAAPPLLGMILRPDPEGTERHTLENILATKSYTLNAVPASHVTAAHQTSARYPRDTSEFTACGFTEAALEQSHAPGVSESPLQIACALQEHQELAINGTHLLIGEVVCLSLADGAVREDGSIDLAALNLAAVTGLDSYHNVAPGQRFAYAKPDQDPHLLD